MADFEKNLFSNDEDWLVNFYRDTGEIFDSIHFFAKYIQRRFPSIVENQIENIRSAFLIEGIEIAFSKECPRRDFRVGFAEGKIKLTLPDKEEYDELSREEIISRYEERYSYVIKESHTRVMALFWRMLSPEAKEKIQKELTEEFKDKKTFQGEIKEKLSKNNS